MCGIIGVTGDDHALDTIFDGLRRLEYRGYDSAGVALAAGGTLWRERSASGTRSVEELARAEASAPRARAGVGHTRWATHGEPSVANAHPHVDCTGSVALVHNGIIENHAELAESLRERGHVLTSETDTEVLAHLVEEEMAHGRPLADALRATLSSVHGAFSVVAIERDEPELLVASRRSVPLLVAVGEETAYVASDVSALLGRATRYFALEDGQVAEVRPKELTVTTLDGEQASPTPVEIDPSWDVVAAQKGGHRDFMSKEIFEQPRAIADTLLDRRAPDGSVVLEELGMGGEELRGVERVVLAACGSSYHAAMVAAHALERWAGLPAEVAIASELRYRAPVLGEKTLVVGVSQSGETLDTLEALREARRMGAPTVVVSNVVHSSMARESRGAVYTRAGPEVSVASTKCHTAQMVALELLTLALAQARSSMDAPHLEAAHDALEQLPSLVAGALDREREVAAVAGALEGARDYFFIGRGVGYPVALEGALKLKEISYLHAEGYPAGELKHGPLALVGPGTVVVAVLDPLREKMLSNASEAAARGATMVGLAHDGEGGAGPLGEVFDHLLFVPRVDDPLVAPVVELVALQLLAYHLAVSMGNDVDRPRNLAKTVTVE